MITISTCSFIGQMLPELQGRSVASSFVQAYLLKNGALMLTHIKIGRIWRN
jgi:hypothetical protein